MKCIMCKICEAANAAVDKKLSAWASAQMNTLEIWQRETDHDRIVHTYDLLNADPVEGFKECLALAEQGSVWSMAAVGWAFETGNGTSPDMAKAEKWYRRAFERESDYGLLRLGHLYVTQGQYAEAEEVFRSGAERGWAPAMYRLAWTYSKSADWPQKRDEVLTLLERASAVGDLSAKRFLAIAMMRGWFGWRRIPSGIRMNIKVANDLFDLIKDDDEVLAAKDNGMMPLEFFRHFVQRFSLGFAGIPVAQARSD
jgi:TPR repeat protein